MAKKKAAKSRMRKKFLRYFWGLFTFSVLFVVALITSIIIGIFGKLPSTEKLENPASRLALATEVISVDGVILGKYFNENRSFVEYDDLSLSLTKALISTEDVRYYQHSGIDWKGTSSIPLYLLRGKKKGASTITQQLAKNLFPRKKFDNIFIIIIRKLKEWIIAIRLERFYTKEEIITMYLNTVDFGSNSYGIKSASKTYFNKEPGELNVQEAATLIGVLKATSTFNPKLNPENSKERRNVVLSQMKKYGEITKQEYDSVSKLPIELNYRVESHNRGLARYFREYLRIYLNDWCKENNIDLYSSGLKIYTTIDSRMQTYAEHASRKHLSQLQEEFFKHKRNNTKAPFDWRMTDKQIEQVMHQALKRSDRYRDLKKLDLSFDEILKVFNIPVKMRIFAYKGDIDTILSPMDSIKYYKYFLNPGFMAMETQSGHIVAWVGGIEYRYFKYDHVNVHAKRQVGSTFKPFVYTTAIMNGYSPCLKVPNMPVIFPEFDNWKPKNADGKYGEMKSLQWGLANSVNCITAWVIKQVGAEATVQLARKMGITSHIDPYPSICLGTYDISVIEMISALNTYTNKGVWVEPIFITKIEDRNGYVLKEFVPREVEVLDEPTNYVMLDMLMNVVNRGTANRLRYRYGFTNQIAAKTGTTQNNSDGWFIGMTPQITAGGWVGAEDRGVHFNSTALGQGANMTLPIWAYFMQQVYADSTLNIKKINFVKPEEDLPVEIECYKYKDESDLEFKEFDKPF